MTEETIKKELKKHQAAKEIVLTGVSMGVLMGALFTYIIMGKIHTDMREQIKKENSPTNAHIEYVNNDSLPDLVYKTGEVYLQTKKGNFISYEDALQQQKEKLDSIYQIKQDSLKGVFENKLEKRVK